LLQYLKKAYLIPGIVHVQSNFCRVFLIREIISVYQLIKNLIRNRRCATKIIKISLPCHRNSLDELLNAEFKEAFDEFDKVRNFDAFGLSKVRILDGFGSARFSMSLTRYGM
jgi:hypothetical protein